MGLALEVGTRAVRIAGRPPRKTDECRFVIRFGKLGGGVAMRSARVYKDANAALKAGRKLANRLMREGVGTIES